MWTFGDDSTVVSYLIIMVCFFFSSRRRHTSGALVTGVQTCALPISDYYPNISLSALIGFQSLGLSNLFDAGSKYGNGGVAISLPIFDGGRIEGRYRGEIGRASCRERVC